MTQRTIHLLINLGDGSFNESILESGSVSSVNAGDVDGDSVPDLLIAVDAAGPEVPVSRVKRNQLDGTFSDLALVGASISSGKSEPYWRSMTRDSRRVVSRSSTDDST